MSRVDDTYLDIARDACIKAAEAGEARFHTFRGGISCFYPISDNGNIGVGFLPEYHYLVYLDRGFASFPMKAIYGKTIAMMVGGKIIFRKVNGINRFRTGFRTYWQRDSDGNLQSVEKQRRSWVHPGFGPTNFVNSAIREAVHDGIGDLAKAKLEDKYEELDKLWS